MCGICGAAWTDAGRALGDPDLAAMMARIEHRGPDDSGTYRDAHAALGFRRLSIVDLAGGHQPLSNEDGTVWTVFNGEIYNFPALRHRLEARGHTLRSRGRHRGPGPPLRGRGARDVRAAARDVRPGDLGRPPPPPGPGPRPARAEAPGLPPRGRSDRLRQRAEGPAGAARGRRSPAGRPAGARPVPDLRLRPPPGDDPARGPQAPPGPLRRLARGDARAGPLLGPRLGRRASSARRARTPSGSARRSARPSASRWSPTSRSGAFLSGGIDSTIIVGLMQAGVEPAGEDLLDRVRRPGLRREPLRRDGRAAPGHRAPRVRRRARGPGRRSRPWPGSSTSRSPTARPCRPGTSPARRAGEVTVALTGDAGDELFAGYDRYRALALAAPASTGSRPARARSWAGRWPAPCPASSRAKTPTAQGPPPAGGDRRAVPRPATCAGSASSTSPAALGSIPTT